MKIIHEQFGRLRSRDLSSVAEAVDAFGEDDGLLLCRVRPPRSLFALILSKISPCFTIPEGFYALVLYGGKDDNYSDGSATWPAGLHWGPPWRRVTYLVTKQSVIYRCKVKRCVTRDNLLVEVLATIVFRVQGDVDKGEDPTLVRKFVYELGVRGLEAQLEIAVEEGIRIMVRSTLHQAVYALVSGGGVIRRRPHSPPSLSLESTAIGGMNCSSGATAGTAAARAEGKGKLPEIKPVNLRKAKRTQVSPTQEDLSPRMSFAANQSETSRVSYAGSGVRNDAAAEVKQSSSSPLLPKIERGLRASRIVPADAADKAAEVLAPGTEQSTISNDIQSTASSLIVREGDHRRVYPEEALRRDKTSHNDDGDGGNLISVLPSRPVPAVTNVDAKHSPSSSESLDVPRSVPVFPNSSYNNSQSAVDCCPHDSCASNCASVGARLPQLKEDCNRAQQRVGMELPPQPPGDLGRGCNGKWMPLVDADMLARVGGNISIGRRYAEELRDRLNRMFSPQGVEVTSVMVGSVELPSDIAANMSEKTLNVSLAEEQRAAKIAVSQKVRHAEEVQGLHQRHRIERALAVKEGDEEVEKARVRLACLRARAIAIERSVAAASAVTEQRLVCEAEREISRSLLRETECVISKTSVSEKGAHIIEAKGYVFQVEREAEAGLEVAQNTAKAREFIDSAEGIGARMLREARAHLLNEKRIQVWRSLAENNLALVTALPLVAPAIEERRGAKLVAHSLTALLLGEDNFGAQLLGNSVSSRNARLLAARRERMELGTQMAFAAANGDATGIPFTLLFNSSGPPSCTVTRVQEGVSPVGSVIGRDARDVIDRRRRNCGSSSRQGNRGGRGL